MQASDGSSQPHNWSPHPVAAMALRVSLCITPILLGWLCVRLSSPVFYHPPGRLGLVVWLLQAIPVGVVAARLAKTTVDRLAPLPVLLSLSVVFPGAAPSRFGVALRAGSTRKMTESVPTLSGEITEAAGQAIELVARLSRHERNTRGHVERVRAYGELIGAELGLSQSEMAKLRWGLLLHDVGKLHVPAAILNKDGKPTNEEWAILREHPGKGAVMLEPLREWLGSWVDAAGHHHEQWSGDGYPQGLAGDEIALAGRICAVADAYDVMTSKRSYKQPRPHGAAGRELVACAGTHFDPTVVRAMLRVGIQRTKPRSPLGWLLELPGVAELAAEGARLPLAPLAVAASVVAATVTGVAAPQPTEPLPESLALVDQLAERTTTSTPPVVTTAPPATPAETASPTPRSTTPPPVTPAPTSSSTAPTTTTIDTTTTVATTVLTTTVTPTTAPTTVPAPTTTTTVATTITTVATTAPTTSPPGSSFVILDAADVPASLAADQLQSADSIFLFLEASSVTLTQPLTVRAVVPASEVRVAEWAAETTLSAGTTVCSWFLHFDPSPGVERIEATVTLPSTIIGYGGWPVDFFRSDFLALGGVAYNYDQSDNGDFITISGSEFTGAFTALPGRTDQMRIYTSC